MELRFFLKENATLDEDLTNRVEAIFHTIKYEKREQVLSMGNLSEKVFYIEKGLARTFYFSNDKDITHLFFSEGDITLPVESVFYRKPSPYGLELLEDSVLRIADYGQLQELIATNPTLLKLMNKLLIDTVMLFSNRLYSIQFQSAKEKYSSLLKMHPNIILRAPLGHIASYLGITQQTLSVIRAEK